MIWVLLIVGCVVNALPEIGEAPKLTLDELIGAGTFAPPTLPPDTTKDWGIPPNPEAMNPSNPVKGIPLPVFDPAKKWDGTPPPNENRDRFIPMPEGSFHIEFSKDNPPQEYNLSAPIHIDLSKYISAKFECGFCLKIADALKQEIKKKGVQQFTDDLQKSCQAQKDTVPAQAQTNCALIEKVKVERLSSETPESICMSEKRCKSQEEITEGNKHMDELALANKEEDEMREKWKKQNEISRQIVEAQEEKWRRDFKRTHNDTMEPFKPFLVNLPEGFDEGSGDDNWKPDFGGWNVENSTDTEPSVETTTVALGDSTSPAEESADEGEVEETAEKKVTTGAESAPVGEKFKPLAPMPSLDFLHEVIPDSVSKEVTAAPTSSVAPETGAEGAEVEEEPAVVAKAGVAMAAVESSTPGGMEASTTASVEGVTPSADEAGPEPTTLFATTEAPTSITKSAEQKAAEEQARSALQSTILEAKKTVDEDIGFMSKPVVHPNRTGTAAWANGPRVNLHEFVSDHHLGTASSPKATVDAANVETNIEKALSSSVEPRVPAPARAPVQCDPPKKASSQFSARPTTGQSSDAAPVETAAAAAAEPEATKLEVTEEQEGPANMAIAKSRPMRVVNRVVQTQFSVDDIAK